MQHMNSSKREKPTDTATGRPSFRWATQVWRSISAGVPTHQHYSHEMIDIEDIIVPISSIENLVKVLKWYRWWILIDNEIRYCWRHLRWCWFQRTRHGNRHAFFVLMRNYKFKIKKVAYFTMRRADGAESLLYNSWRSRGSNNSIHQEFIQHDINLFDNTPTLNVSYKFLRCGNRIGVPLSALRSFNPVGAVHQLKLTTRTMRNNPVGAQFSIPPTYQVCFSGLGKNQPWSHYLLTAPRLIRCSASSCKHWESLSPKSHS